MQYVIITQAAPAKEIANKGNDLQSCTIFGQNLCGLKEVDCIILGRKVYNKNINIS